MAVNLISFYYLCSKAEFLKQQINRYDKDLFLLR